MIKKEKIVNRFLNWGNIFIVISILLLLVSCFPKVFTTVKTPINTSLSDYESVKVHVTTLVPDTSEQVSLLEDYIVHDVMQKAIFSQVVKYSENPDVDTDLQINLKIIDLSKAGLFTSATIKTELEIIEGKTGNKLSITEIRDVENKGIKKSMMEVSGWIADYLEENRY